MKVDLLVKNVRVFNAYTKEFIQADVAVEGGLFLYIGTDEVDKLEPVQVVDGQGRYMIPGLIDIHMHIESSMATPQTFTQALVKNGVTTVVAEPHEIGNVLGVEGIAALMAAAKGCPADVMFAMPSSIPSTSMEMETVGYEFALPELKEMMEMDGVICLGEVMNYIDVVYRPDSKTNQFIQTVKKTKPHFRIEGHCPRLVGLELARFIHAGVDSDHTEQTLARMKERIANGMFVQLQDKSILPDILAHLMESGQYEHISLVTDDVMPDKLANQGHLNVLVKKAITRGFSPEVAVYTSTFTPARRMGMHDRGSIAPGKIADFLLLDDIANFELVQTYKEGKVVYDRAAEPVKEGRCTSFPEHFYHSVHLDPLTEDRFTVKVDRPDGMVKCRLMTVLANTTFTRADVVEVPVKNGELDWESTPYCLAVIVERHGKGGHAGYGLVGGDAIKRGAVATTYAHDHHNLLIMGRTKRDMLVAGNHIIAEQGGYCVADEGKIIAHSGLPIAGILSDKPIPELGAEIAAVTDALVELGYNHPHILMSVSTLSLPVSQELKMSDKGLIDTVKIEVVPLIVD